MSTSPTPDLPADLPPEVQHLLARAIRLETPCSPTAGSGAMVWHAWRPARDQGHPPVVLLHGGSGSWTHWLRNIDALVASGRQVYAADLPGFGDSAAPARGTDADALTEPVEHGLQQLLGPSACDLVAFSFGGMVAGFIAAQFPARAHRLVLVGAPGLGVASRNTIALTAWRHLSDPAAREAVHRQNLAVLMLFRPEAITALALRLHTDNTLRDRMKGRRLAYSEALAEALVTVTCPVHAIYGREDALYRQRQDALLQALRHAPDFRGLQWIEDAGHWVQFERPAAFDAALLAILDGSGHG
ncbi:MAG: alpha/beta hydrolase [Polaromonas sp. 35-63-240]|jgi:pimeloyl-ACP methyl ester carboxylesterase|uniref:alpha/beta fold hydrolase n=1 Tax=Polaromonas sp. TaxID=1869339 RepID=UPI000BCB8616|nr:alpha/beta fold hydrolase [Polaromonas sp.]OYY53186.1 MAG: alpha/beta hydrolase [Polaromonas sp. 35-63-240]HQS30518.1 alpha/beta fold hydrolase [Polaromonas sp.]HQS89518.1 alpha/beta fold hydrolase [Polaromonas sp.]